jgi:hypothetical protein
MILAALVVGAVTAFYYGLRPGALAAGVTFGVFLAAAVVPALALWAYLAVGGGVATVLALGPRRADPTHAARATRLLRRGVAVVRARFPRK